VGGGGLDGSCHLTACVLMSTKQQSAVRGGGEAVRGEGGGRLSRQKYVLQLFLKGGARISMGSRDRRDGCDDLPPIHRPPPPLPAGGKTSPHFVRKETSTLFAYYLMRLQRRCIVTGDAVANHTDHRKTAPNTPKLWANWIKLVKNIKLFPKCSSNRVPRRYSNPCTLVHLCVRGPLSISDGSPAFSFARRFSPHQHLAFISPVGREKSTVCCT
jgi:hypothetical protein